MAETQWFFTRGGQQAGPVSAEQLRQMVAAGQVAPHELVWREGMANWQPLGSVPELGAAPPMPPPGAFPGQPYAPPNAPFPQPMPYGQAPQENYRGMAIGGFVCALLGLLCLGPLFGVIAVVLGGLSLSGMNRVRNPRGKGLAVAALVIGIIDIVAGAVGIFYFLHHPGANPFMHMRRF